MKENPEENGRPFYWQKLAKPVSGLVSISDYIHENNGM